MLDIGAPLSLTVINKVQQSLIAKVWEQVAANNVSKMAPKSTGMQHQYAVQSLVYQSFAQKYAAMERLTLDKDPVPAKMDNIAAGVMQIQQRKGRKNTKEDQPGLFRDRSKSFISEIQKRSMRSSKISPHASKQVTAQKQGKTQQKQSFFISLGNQEKEDYQLQKMRKIQMQRANQQFKYKKMLQQRQAQKRGQAQASSKIVKDKSSFTFDYQGDLYNINPTKIQTQAVRTMRQQFGKTSVQPKQHKDPQTTHVSIQKYNTKDDRATYKSRTDRPQFSQKPFSITQALQDIQKIAEGVKITDLKNGKDAVTLQHKAKKLQGLRQYRLKDYKSITKDKSFVQFAHTSVKKNTMLDFSASEVQIVNDNKAKTTRVSRNAARSRGKSQYQIKAAQTQAVLQTALGRGLPFIRTKGLRFHDLGMTKTFQTLQPNSTSKRSSKSKSNHISIGDTRLFQQTFLR